MDGGFMMMMVFAMLTATAIRRDQASGDETQKAERQRKFRAMTVLLAGVGALVYAALVAIMSLALLYDLTLGHGPRSVLLFLMIPGLAAAAALLAWIGLLLLRDKNLHSRLARACAAAYEAFFEPTSEGAKPKPARGEHDLD